MKNFFFIISVLLSINSTVAQAVDSTHTDSVKMLNEIVISAFNYNRPPSDIPASVGVLDTETLQRFSNWSLLPAINTVPGVRMEERSPGSYRLSVRGSTLRSPFGVRNVKLYWQGAALTDAGGNTYLNKLDPAMIGSAEVIKGPGSSLYGAGTGGVVLFEPSEITAGIHIKSSLQIGSYESTQWNGTFDHGGEMGSQRIQYFHQQSDGYRDQTRMYRDVINGLLSFHPGKHDLKVNVFCTDLYYETPGALTKQEFETNPKQSRPATALPSAKAQEASVELKSIFLSISDLIEISSHVRIQTNLFGNAVNFKNPSIRNVEERDERTIGVRSTLSWNALLGRSILNLTTGGEFQAGSLPVDTYENNYGAKGLLLTRDKNKVVLYSLFAQEELRINAFSFTLGVSVNGFSYHLNRSIGDGVGKHELHSDPVFIPRAAILLKISDQLSVYSSISRGFSPPTLAEVISSNGELNTKLKPEIGTNLETGLKSSWLSGKLHAEIAAYSFAINNAIVIQRTQDIAEYFANAGRTRQRGLESSVKYKGRWFQGWLSQNWQYFRFVKYETSEDDFSGNKLTGAPSGIFSAGITTTINKIYFSVDANITGKLPLNDANSDYAASYKVFNMKCGYQLKRCELYAGCDNIFNEQYSLGNDINAFGGRYYNAAPARFFYTGLKIDFNHK